MKRRHRLGLIALSTILAASGVITGSIGPASALDQYFFDDGGVVVDQGHQHGGTGGHLPAGSKNVALVGKAKVHNAKKGQVSEVGVLGNYAYLGSFHTDPCEGGVYVMDISDLANPHEVGFIAASPGSFVGEAAHPVHLRTGSFTGDVLVYNNELCDTATVPPAVGGATLVNISDPLHPVVLANGFGAVEPGVTGRARTAHSAYVWQVGEGPAAKAYVMLPDSRTPMLPIFDITDPAHPVQVIDIDVAATFPQILQRNVGLDTVFFHDAVVREEGNKQIMLLSMWDAGYVKLDVTDPAHPVYVADTDFTLPDPELLKQTGQSLNPGGHAHYAEFSKNGKYVIATDENFSPTRVSVKTDNGGEFRAIQAGSAQLPAGGSLSGKAVFVGLGCNASPPPAASVSGGPYIALVERGGCTFTEKAANVESRGYAGTIVFNRTGGGGGCGALVSPSVTANKPFFFVNRLAGLSMVDAQAGYDEQACLASTASIPVPIGTLGRVVTLQSQFAGWGYVHLFGNNDVNNGKMVELDTFAIPQGMDPAKTTGFGNLTVHKVAASGQDSKLAYLSYYAGGFRVLRIQKDKLVEVGMFIDTGGNDFWGVQVLERGNAEYVLASDRDYGLYIFRYIGP
jgi:hypothetical protein